MHEDKHQLKKCQDTLDSLLKKNFEYKSWVDNKVFDLIDISKTSPRKGRWVLTIKTDKQGNVLKATACWVLRGFQDK